MRLALLAATVLASAPPEPAAEGPAPPPPNEPASTERPNPARPTPPRPDVGGADLGFDEDLRPAELGLERQSSGDYHYVDPGGRFSATFNEDGTVTFADPWNRPDRAHPDRGKLGRGGYAGVPGLNPLAGIAMTGPTEWIMLAKGLDPSRTAKSDLLERTHELRTRLAVAWARQRIDERLRTLEAELLGIWTDHTKTRPARRELLFWRWDECDERFAVAPADIPTAAISEIDRYRLEAAQDARERIVRFVRRHLPRTSQHRFTAAELARLNAARSSRAPFDPYR